MEAASKLVNTLMQMAGRTETKKKRKIEDSECMKRQEVVDSHDRPERTWHMKKDKR